MRTVLPGAALDAPGILKNAVPVEALYDREAAHRHTFKNLLQREGYEDLDAVRDEGRKQGLERGILILCEALAIAPTPEQQAGLGGMTTAELEALEGRLLRERRW